MRVPTVLVVDDDEDIRDLLAFVLQQAGYRVALAKHGGEAFDWIVAHGLPQLILLDMNMPVMNGPAFVRELRAHGLTGCSIVVITAASDAQRSAEEIDAAGFVGKPFELDGLLDTVRIHTEGCGLETRSR